MNIPVGRIRLDGGTQPRAMIDQIVVAEYAEAMREGASFPAVVVWFDGTDYWLSDGYHRVHAALTLGLDTITADVRTGTQQDAQWHSYGVNATHGLRRTNDDKRRAVEAALRHPNAATMSNVLIAKHCGVSEFVVRKYRTPDFDNIEVKPRIGLDGRTINTANIGRTAEPQITHYAPIDPAPPRHEPVEDEEEKAEWWHRPEEEPAEEGRNSEASPIDYKPTVLLSSDEKYDGNEWYTPKEWIEAARVLYGGMIDLDPASCEEAQHVVQATTYYTKDQDGLSLPWIGNVWCNPPYSFPEVQLFARKAAREYAIGNATSILMLVNNCTDAGWFVELSKASRVVMFSLGRASFWRPNQQTFATRQGQALFYIGPNPGKCVDAFSHIAYTLPNAH